MKSAALHEVLAAQGWAATRRPSSVGPAVVPVIQPVFTGDSGAYIVQKLWVGPGTAWRGVRRQACRRVAPSLPRFLASRSPLPPRGLAWLGALRCGVALSPHASSLRAVRCPPRGLAWLGAALRCGHVAPTLFSTPDWHRARARGRAQAQAVAADLLSRTQHAPAGSTPSWRAGQPDARCIGIRALRLKPGWPSCWRWSAARWAACKH